MNRALDNSTFPVKNPANVNITQHLTTRYVLSKTLYLEFLKSGVEELGSVKRLPGVLFRHKNGITGKRFKKKLKESYFYKEHDCNFM